MAADSLLRSDLEKIAQSLSRGFETLLEEVKDLAQREITLRKNLEVAEKEVNISFSSLQPAFPMTRNQD